MAKVELSKLLECSENASKFFSAVIDKNGKLTAEDAVQDACSYFKLPMLLLESGKLVEANRVLDYIKSSYLLETGDFKTSESCKSINGAYCEYWGYINGWVVAAAQRLGRFDISQPGFEYLMKFYHPELGGFTTKAPYGQLTNEVDMLTTAHMGMVCLYFNDMKKARSSGNLLIKFWNSKPDDDTILLRMSNTGEVISQYPDEAALFHAVKRNAPNQLYFMIGYPIAFLAKLYQATGDAKFLQCAKEILNFGMQCDASVYRCNFSHKLGWAASILAQITKEQSLATFALEIAGFLTTLQSKNGVFLADSPPQDRFDQSAEIALWLLEIYSYLSCI